MSQSALKQESFEIQNDNSPRKKVVRQDRYEVAGGRCWIEWNSKKFEVLNVSPFGVALLVKESDLKWFEQENENSNVSFSYFDRNLQTLHLKVLRRVVSPTSPDGDLIIGCEILGEPLVVEQLKAIEASYEIITNQSKLVEVATKVPPEFRALILEMQNWLISLKNKIDEVERSIPVGNYTEEQIFKNTVIENIGDFVGTVVPRLYREIPPMLEKCDAATKELATQFAREHLGPYVYGAPFAARAYYKPRGYAGDYEMMNHLYRDEGVGRSLFDQCMHRYFVDEPAGQAVKNRGAYLCEKLKNLHKEFPNKKHFRVVSVASGPAKEVQLFLEAGNFPAGVTYEFHMIDQDEESLKHAQRHIQSIERFVKSGFKFEFHNLAIKNILARGLPNGKYDFVYSAGLFDYFTDPVSTAAAARFYEALNPNSQTIIGNFSTDNPCSVFMELVLDWHLIYRSPADLKRIFGPVAKDIQVEKEQLGINLFAVLKKP